MDRGTPVSTFDGLEQALARARPSCDGGAFVTIRAEQARTEAAQCHGPLAGRILAVKDLAAVEGVVRSRGSAVYATGAPEPVDAAAVAALRDAGAVVIGTVALHELAFGVSGINDFAGTPGHPLDPLRIPGGSSSGSAVAVAEGSAEVAIGSDTGGSIRIPAALCGVVGFKASYGCYPLEGVAALAPSLDHLGFLAPRVDLLTEAHMALVSAGAETPDGPWCAGVDRAAFARCDPEVADSLQRALDALGAAGVEIVDTTLAWDDAFEITAVVLAYEAAATYRQLTAAERRLLGGDVAERLATSAAITPAEYEAAGRARDELAVATASAFVGVDVVLAPSVPLVAPRIAEARGDPGLGRRLGSFTRLANLTGLPALSLPVRVEGLPVGLQIVGSGDEAVLAFAAFAEAVVA